jgi:hypothetical protein
MVPPSTTRDTPLTAQSQAGLDGHVPSPAVTSFRRDSILYMDLLGLRPTTSSGGHPSMMDIVRSVPEFLYEANLAHIDQAEAREDAHMPKTVRERLSDIITYRLLLLYQVSIACVP